MDVQEFLERSTPFVKQHFLPLALAFVGILCLRYGFISMSQQKTDTPDILADGASDVAPVVHEITPIKAKEITVDIEGAVIKPGVYKFKADGRVQDVLIAAGGMNEKADREKVAKGLNLAAPLTDGGKIYIPFQGENALATSGENVLGSSTDSSGPININTATADQLDTLQGVGKVTAAKIIANRPYGSVDELLSKKVVSKKVFDENHDKITVN